MINWRIISTPLEKKEGQLCQILMNGEAISRKYFFEQLAEEEEWQLAWISFLKNLPYAGYYWEVPSSTTQTIKAPFEFVILASTAFGRRRPAFRIFKDYFKSEMALAFPNLSGDAMLIVPNRDGEKDFSHLAAFMQNAGEEQLMAFWQLAAQIYLQQLSNERRWLSTAGLGVAWLHLRIDSRPKYYKYGAYR